MAREGRATFANLRNEVLVAVFTSEFRSFLDQNCCEKITLATHLRPFARYRFFLRQTCLPTGHIDSENR
jgi:hypothetical protein